MPSVFWAEHRYRLLLEIECMLLLIVCGLLATVDCVCKLHYTRRPPSHRLLLLVLVPSQFVRNKFHECKCYEC